MRSPAIDPETQEPIADYEIDFGEFKLSVADENKLRVLMPEARMKKLEKAK